MSLSPLTLLHRVSGVLDRPAAAAAALVVAVIATWPLLGTQPGADLDWSWRAALAMRAYTGSGQGNDFVFTYGPLGFLTQPSLFFGWTFLAAFLVLGATQLALAGTVYLEVRRVASALPAVGTAAAFAALTPANPGDFIPGLMAVWIVRLMRRPPSTTTRAMLAVSGLAAAAAVQLLIKPGAGSVACVLVGFFVVSAIGGVSRSAAVAAGSFAAMFLLGWLASGGGVTDIPQWLRASGELVNGYSSAMAYQIPQAAWVVPAFVVIIVVVVWEARFSLQDLPRRRRLVGLLALLATCYFYFRQGTTRADPGHLAQGAGGLAFVATTALSAGRRTPTVVIAVLLTYVASVFGPTVDLRVRASAIRDQVHILLDSEYRKSKIAEGQEVVRAILPMDPPLRARIGRRTVHVAPFAASVVWAYNLNWRPLPIPQSYAAYTTYLDEKNAAFLHAGSRPDVVLRDAFSGTLDGHAAAFEAPDEFLATLCNYRFDVANGRWQLYVRDTDRCAKPAVVGHLQVGDNELVRVPAATPGHILAVAIQAEENPIDRLLTATVKAFSPATLSLNEAPPGRAVLGTLDDFNLVHAPANLRLPAEYAASLDVHSLRLKGVASAKYTFYSIPVR